jgi:hypothetical protein
VEKLCTELFAVTDTQPDQYPNGLATERFAEFVSIIRPAYPVDPCGFTVPLIEALLLVMLVADNVVAAGVSVLKLRTLP